MSKYFLTDIGDRHTLIPVLSSHPSLVHQVVTEHSSDMDFGGSDPFS